MFARYLNTSESTIQKWEAGKTHPSGLAMDFAVVSNPEFLKEGAAVAGKEAARVLADVPGLVIAGSAAEALQGADALTIVTEW